MEWLEVRIVVSSERLVEQSRIKMLDCDRQPLDNERPFSAVTRQLLLLLLNKVCLISFLVCDRSSLAGLCMQDYKSPWVAIMICTTLVNTQTHTERHTDSFYIYLYSPYNMVAQANKPATSKNTTNGKGKK